MPLLLLYTTHVYLFLPVSCGYKFLVSYTRKKTCQNASLNVEISAKMIIDKENAPSKEIPTCIICVGSTGSGKSATISKYTRLPIQSNSGMARVTTKCSMYKR